MNCPGQTVSTAGKSSPPRWLPVAAVLAVLLAAWFRFSSLDSKLIWFDETITALRASGYSLQEMATGLFDGRLLAPADILHFQQPGPGKTIIDIIKASALEDPQNPPFYYIMAFLWSHWSGGTLHVLRSLSAFVSLFEFPAIYFFSCELFESTEIDSRLGKTVGWLAVLLVALSPLHFLYAQEARVYSFVIVTILVSSWLLLKAMRLGQKKLWFCYALCVALGIYQHPFFLYTVAGHGLYVWLSQRGKNCLEQLKPFVLALAFAFVAFAPWGYMILLKFMTAKTPNEVLQTSIPFMPWLKTILFNWCRLFIDFAPGYFWLFVYIVPLVLLLELYALFFVIRRSSKKSWLLLVLLILIPNLALVPSDLLFGGIKALVARYFFAPYLAVELAVAYLFAVQFNSARSFKKLFWAAVFVLLIAGGIISDNMICRAETWWTKPNILSSPQVAKVINQARKPLVVFNYQYDGLNDLLTLSHMLEPKVRLAVVTGKTIPVIPAGFSDVFVYIPGARQLVCILENRPDKKSAQSISVPIQELDNAGILGRLQIPQ